MVLVIALLTGGVIPNSSVSAEESASPFVRYPRAMGIAAGQITGAGLAWMYWPDRLGFQIVGGATYSPADGDAFFWDDRTLDYNVGGQLYRSVFTDTWAGWLSGQLYMWGGLRHNGYIPVVYEEANDGYRERDFVAGVSGGVGIGVELLLYRHFSIPIEFGYVATGEFLGSEATPFIMALAGQTGFRYRY